MHSSNAVNSAAVEDYDGITQHGALSGHYGVRSASAQAGSGRGISVCVCLLISQDDMFALCPDANPCVCVNTRRTENLNLSL